MYDVCLFVCPLTISSLLAVLYYAIDHIFVKDQELASSNSASDGSNQGQKAEPKIINHTLLSMRTRQCCD